MLSSASSRDGKIRIVSLLVFLCLSSEAHAKKPDGYAREVCTGNWDFRVKCITITKEMTGKRRAYLPWEKLGFDVQLLQSLNRRNSTLWRGQVVLVPKDEGMPDLYYSPFPEESVYGNLFAHKHIIVDLNILAWAAYDTVGHQVKWGPANGGRIYCEETGKPKCKTHPGVWRMIRKGNATTRSNLYPIECKNKKRCGFKMPFYVQFHPDGTGLHGAKSLPGYNASHGCTRLLTRQAKWLNQQFIDKDTFIIIEDYR